MAVQCHNGKFAGIFREADAGDISVCIYRKLHGAGHVRFDVVRTYFYFRVRVSGFRILVGVFSRIIFQRSNLRCFSREHRKRIGRNFRLVEADESNHGIIGTELQGAVETELFLIHPVWDTVDNRVLFTVFGNLAFTIAIKQFHKKDIVIADKSYHCSVWRKDGDLLRSAVGQPFNNVVCRNSLIISFQRVDIMYSCIRMPVNRSRFRSNKQFLTVG